MYNTRKLRNIILSTSLALPLSQFVIVEGMAAENGQDLSLKQKVDKIMLTNDSFVEKVTVSNLSEIEISKLALEKSTTPKIQTFAQSMIKDHGTASTELSSIAISKNIKVPVEPDHSEKETIKKLNDLSGADFDKAFVKKMKEDHEKAVSLFEVAVADKKLDPDLHQFAEKTLPTLREHQHDALQLN